MTEDYFERLVSSLQSALADVAAATDYRAKRALIASARVQAECAKAVAINRLAETLAELLEQPTKEKP